jgi:3-(3-hydroxy-phenyl)propionate hydroxylase
VNLPAVTDGVIVVGAGPVGCTVAILLADQGIPVTVLERRTRPHQLPRAVHLDDEVARTLHRLGVSEAFLANSRPGSGLRLLDAQHRVLAEFRGETHPGVNGFPAANMFHQPDLDELLFDQVAEHPLIDFQRGVDVRAIEGVRQPLPAAPITVRARRLEDETTQTFTGRLVLGCDGANSTIRQLVGVTTHDLGFTERWLVVDIRADHDLGTWDGAEQVCDPARAATFMQVNRDRYRWEYQLHDGEDEADLTNGPALGRMLEPWTRRRDLDGLDVVRSTAYTFRARLATHFQVGRVFLLGDAAHLTPPFIGQGLAAGLRDADNLAWKIAHVLTGQATPDLLATYETERRPHAKALIRKAVLVGWAMTGGQDRAATVRRIALSLAVRSPRVRNLIGASATPRLKTGALQQTPRMPHPPRSLRIGGLIPNPLLSIANGKQVRLDDILRGQPAVLTSRCPEQALLSQCHQQRLTPIRVTDSDPQPDRGWVEAQLVHSGHTMGLQALADDPTLTLVVRPDGVIASVATRSRLPDLPWVIPIPATPA